MSSYSVITLQEFPHLAAVREAFAQAGLTLDVVGMGSAILAYGNGRKKF